MDNGSGLWALDFGLWGILYEDWGLMLGSCLRRNDKRGEGSVNRLPHSGKNIRPQNSPLTNLAEYRLQSYCMSERGEGTPS